MTPWHDPDVEIWTLNDGYLAEGFQRTDRHFDLHPPNKFFFAPEPPPGQKPMIFSHQIPEGHYVRPSTHLDWLATQACPVYLHPDHATLYPPSATWPSARAFPKADLEAHFGRYFTSSPSWMLALAIVEGYTDIEIYGIHLSTESEYIEQRPGFEYLIGCVLGAGKQTITTEQGLRRYQTAHGSVSLPDASPVLSAKYQYAFEPSPHRKLDPLKWEQHKAQVKRERIVTALRTASWINPWTRFTEPIPNDPEGKERTSWRRVSTLQTQLGYYEAVVADWQDQLSRIQAGL
jgi:hypothetical protein